MTARPREDGSLCLLAAFLASGAFALYVKWVWLASGGLLTAARFLGRSSVAELSVVERLGFVASDLLVSWLAIPIGAVLVLRLLPRGARAPIALIANFALCAALLVDLGALGNVGRFLTARMTWDAAAWAVDNPDALRDYSSVSHFAGFATLIAFVVVAVRAGGAAPDTFAPRWLRRGASLGLAASAVLAGVGLASGLPPLAQKRCVLAQIADAFYSEPILPRLDEAASADRLISEFRTLSRSPAPSAERAPCFGRDRGDDVILFVLETAPRACASFVDTGGALPGLERLRPRAFVSDHHFTTYPYTTDAVFSLLTGLYPLGREAILRKERSLPVGLFATLAEHGYERRVYSPWPDTFEDDTRLYRMVGTEARYVASASDVAPGSALRTRVRERLARFAPRREPIGTAHPIEERLARDLAALARLENDVVGFIAADRRYAVAFFPQIGHGPWVDLAGHDRIVDRGRELIRLQDEWIGEIAALLSARGRLDHTLIVVTGDHGLRTRAEDPDLPAGACTDISFNVPLLVYAPGALDRTVVLESRTSHVDIAPTLLSLLGLHGAGERYLQGYPLWDAALASRRQFFFADAYFGADAFVEKDAWCMLQSPTGAVFASDRFEFPPATQLTREALERGDPSLPIREISAMQPLFLRTLAREAGVGR